MSADMVTEILETVAQDLVMAYWSFERKEIRQEMGKMEPVGHECGRGSIPASC